MKAIFILFLSYTLSHSASLSQTCCKKHTLLSFTRPKNTLDEHGIGFKYCCILTFWWIWILSFLLNQNWIGFDNNVLKIFTTFHSVLGLQISILNSLVQWSFSNPSWLYPVFFLILSLVVYDHQNKSALLRLMSSKYRFSLTSIDPLSFLTDHGHSVRRVARGGISPPILKVAIAIFSLIKLVMCKAK